MLAFQCLLQTQWKEPSSELSGFQKRRAFAAAKKKRRAFAAAKKKATFFFVLLLFPRWSCYRVFWAFRNQLYRGVQKIITITGEFKRSIKNTKNKILSSWEAHKKNVFFPPPFVFYPSGFWLDLFYFIVFLGVP
jgi:hypothetical protein